MGGKWFLLSFIFLLSMGLGAVFVLADLSGVTLVTPADNANISGTILLSATFTSGTDVANVTFYYNNGIWNSICTNNSSPTGGATCSWNSATILDGTYTFNATATNGTLTYSDASTNIIVDNTAPTVSFVSPTPNAGTNNSGNPFNINVTASDAGIGLSTIVIRNNASDIVQTCSSSPCNISQTLVDGSHTFNATANDTLGNTNSTTVTFTVDNSNITAYSLNVNESDIFYSNATGNNIITLIVNASDAGPAGIAYITANFSALGQQASASLVNMSNYASTLWNASLTINNSNYNFQPFNITVFGADKAGNGITFAGPSVKTILLYNMTTPPLPPSGCMQWDTITTDLGTATNFSAVNFVLAPKINLTCEEGPIPGAPAWTNTFERMAAINFTSLDMSSQTIGQKLQGIPTAMSIQIAPPGQFGDSRIYFNTTFFAELNTTTSLTLYHLPFSSQPTIETDVGAAGINSTSVSWAQGTGEGNLTFTVYGFSGYNISDTQDPTITFNSPTNGADLTDSTPSISVRLNGTSTQISQATFTISGPTDLSYVYSNSTNTANCASVTEGSELFDCVFTSSTLALGSYTLSVSAWDYGDTAGNSASATISFTVEPPGVSGGGRSETSISIVEGQSQDIELSFGDSLSCTVNSKSHSIRISGLFDDSIELTIASEPIKVLLEVSQTKQIDTNGNGLDDLAVTLLSKTNTLVKLRLTSLIEQVKPAPITEEEAPPQTQLPITPSEGAAAPEPTGVQPPITTGIILIIVIAALITAFLYMKKRRR